VDDASLAERAHTWASTAIDYHVGMTGVRTPAAMALHLGGGVCQDYAHILLAVLRLLGVPARYVSGHLLGEGVPHAWVEVLARARAADGSGAQQDRVIAYDPTNRRRARMQYVTVAVGRDFADVSPTSGTFTGSQPGTMTWGKQAAVVDVEYAT
jgi:transglutaminase-like putative cysteine protease